MRNKRTDIDFSKHELIVTRIGNEYAVYQLKIPGTYMNSIKYINTNGILAVTGDFGNWIFCREFHPENNNEGVSDGYWLEKLKISSHQEPKHYSAEKTAERIKEMLTEEDEELSDDFKEFLNELLSRVDDELEYKYYAYREASYDIDYEYIPYEKEVDYQLLLIFDGFDEMCKRMRKECNWEHDDEYFINRKKYESI